MKAIRTLSRLNQYAQGSAWGIAGWPWERHPQWNMETYCSALLNQEKSLEELQRHLRTTEVRHLR